MCGRFLSWGFGFLVGFSTGFIRFKNIKTIDNEIDIGGFSFSPEKKPSFSIGVFGAEGRVRVLNKGQM